MSKPASNVLIEEIEKEKGISVLPADSLGPRPFPRLRNKHRKWGVGENKGVLTSVLQELQGLTTYAFVMLLLAMISLHMLTFRLMVAMVAELC